MLVDHALRHAIAMGLHRLDAQMLLLHALGRSPHDRAWLIAHDNDIVPDLIIESWKQLLVRRCMNEPMAYLIGEKEFAGLNLEVNNCVLVPRPETETLVGWVMNVLPPVSNTAGHIHMLDLGTGSGAIALAIADRRHDVEVTATDVSKHALSVAQANAQRLGLSVRFNTGSWLAAVPGKNFDVIASNPPYIADSDPHLAALTYEPMSALISGTDGLQDIRDIVAQAPAGLKDGGWLLLEHGYNQAHAVRELLAKQGFEAISSRKDLAGIERCSGGRRPPAR